MTPTDFHHRLDSRMLGPLGAARLWWSFPSDDEARRDAARVPVTPDAPLPEPAAGQLGVTWLGHASALLWVDGVTVLVDPVLSPGIPGAAKRLTPPGRTVEGLPPVDAVLISHDHYDHLDVPTLRRLRSGYTVVVPRGVGRYVRAVGAGTVIELAAGESTTCDGVEIVAVYADHDGRRQDRKSVV